MLRILVVALVVLVAAMFLLPRGQRGQPPQTATVLPEARPLADVRFVDKTGRETHLRDFKGDFTLLFFGFTNCPDVCPGRSACSRRCAQTSRRGRRGSRRACCS